MDFIQKFRGAIKIRTDWPADQAAAGDPQGEAELTAFQDFLPRAWPAFHRTAERFVLCPYAVAYRWPGRTAPTGDSPVVPIVGDTLPVLLTAHYDVVPVEADKWTVDPFGAEMRDGFIYGRGAIDMKNMLAGMLEAADRLVSEGFVPGRDIWFVFGGDEERTGLLGARRAADWLAARDVRFAWVLDEGTPVAERYISGVECPLALVSIEEKGFLSLCLTAHQEPGHSSRPPRVQAAAILARALTRIDTHPFPWRLVPTAEGFFRRLSSRCSGGTAFLLRHARTLGPVFFRFFARKPSMAALLHTTVAMTRLFGSSADNVMPSEARAIINLRLLQPWTIDTAIKRIQNIIHDNRVAVSIHGMATEAVPANPEHAHLTGPGMAELMAAVNVVFPGVPVLPFIMTATTDSRHFQDITGGIFRFNPLRMAPGDLAGMHGHDERVSVENLERCRDFYRELLRKL
ncbi:MAG: M20/M25/M40 family metallo-hydrolase [Spirochaetaceae bacterium]|nr:M20/M25/M40 family metallo-hydrolase [Spirochaetaceae bacterium]